MSDTTQTTTAEPVAAPQETTADANISDAGNTTADTTQPTQEGTQQTQGTPAAEQSKGGLGELLQRNEQIQQQYAPPVQSNYSQGQPVQQQYAQQGGGGDYHTLLTNQALQNQKMEALAENQEYLQAAAEHPELNTSSKEYDKKFDDAVYLAYKQLKQHNPNVNMSQVAKELKQWQQEKIEKAVQKERENVEKQLGNKVQGSTSGQSRSQVSSSTTSEVEAAYKKAMTTKKSQDWYAYNVLKKKLQR